MLDGAEGHSFHRTHVARRGDDRGSRRHTLLQLDDCLYGLQPTIPHLTRSALHRCLQRHEISGCPRWKATSLDEVYTGGANTRLAMLAIDR